MSEPWPPAFMNTAPPIDPGTPTAHSKPVRAAAAVRRATTGRLAAPPATTSTTAPGPASVTWGTSMVVKCSPSTRASPGNPVSATSTLEPRPTTSTATPLARTAAVTSARVASSSTAT